MRVATYNIRHGAPAGARADHAGLARTVAGLGVDLLAVQEIERFVFRSGWRDQVGVVASATGLHATFVAARPLGPFGRYGIALFSREPPGAVEFVRLPAFGYEPRMALLARVDLDGTVVTVAVTHLHNRRWVATRQLEVVLDRLDRRAGAHLLMGDLNLEEADVVPQLERRGYAAAVAGPTFPAADPTRTIDWIAGAGVAVVDTGVVACTQSDHYPLVATVVRGVATPN